MRGLPAASRVVSVVPALLDYRRHRLVTDPGEAFLLSKHCQHFKNRRRGGAPGKCRAQRLCNASELHPGALCEGPDDLLGCLYAPWLDRIKIVRQLAQQRTCFRRQHRRRRLLDLQWTRGSDEARAVRELHQGLGPFLEGAHCGEQLLALLRGQGARERGVRGKLRGHVLERGQQIRVCGGTQIMAVEALQPCEVEALSL